MIVGHAAVALAAKASAPRASLGTLMAASFGLDLLWPVFTLAGLESFRIEPGVTAFTPIVFDYYPLSHSLLMALVWGLAAGLLTTRITRSPRAGWIVGALVPSHWVLDAVVHRRDLPLWPGESPMVGLGLWHSVPGTLIIEGLLFAAGIAIYLRVTQPRDRIGTIGLWALLALLAFIWVSGLFSPPPPSPTAVSVSALGLVLIPLWAAWADRHRQAALAAGTAGLSHP